MEMYRVFINAILTRIVVMTCGNFFVRPSSNVVMTCGNLYDLNQCVIYTWNLFYLIIYYNILDQIKCNHNSTT